MPVEPGTRLGHYEIRTQIGAGGMGEVYLARDEKLGRDAAIKVLAAAVSRDADRLRRFEQEACAASRLNHPNILTVYEIGQDGPTHYIAAEFIDGVTLRERLRRAPLSVGEALETAVQIASALAAAHEAGIVHRDIKPENIMLRRDGLVKVLDFGLVKLTESQTSSADLEAPTRGLVETRPGVVFGTAQYMSPEQARGLETDARTDIWSLGCVLYEMLAGRPPFTGATETDLLVAVVTANSAPLSRLAPEVPPQLEEIVSKALEKDRAERYQGVKDFEVDLRRLKKRREFEAELERSLPPDPAAAGVGSVARLSGLAERAAGRTTAPQIGRETSGAQRTGLRRRRVSAPLGAALLLVAAAGLGYGLYSLLSRRTTVEHFRKTKITKLTSSGNVSDVVISPDGKYVVYDVTEGGRQGLWAKYLPTGSTVQIVPPSEVFALGYVTFSNDGNFVYYDLSDRKNPNGTLFQVPVLGGTPKKIVEDVASPVAFSPDGGQIAFVRAGGDAKSTALFVANADGSGARQLAALAGDRWFSRKGLSWSPDGKLIACGTGSTTGGEHMQLSAVAVDSGVVEQLASQPWSVVERVVWLRDGGGIVFLARELSAPNRQVWYLPYPRGEVRRVTNDLNTYSDASLGVTADASALVSMQLERTADIWLTDARADITRARQITTRAQHANGFGGLSWTPDGRIVYASVAGGNPDIWRMKADGTEQKQLTDDPQPDYQPVVSADGRVVVFTSKRAGNWNIWRMDADGGNLRRLTSGDDDEDPDISPDGKWIVYGSYEAGVPKSVWRVSADGGSPARLTDSACAFPRVSPDGRLVACLEIGSRGTPRQRFTLVPLDGDAPSKTIELPRMLPTSSDSISWSADGRALLYVDTSTSGGVGNLWLQPLDGGAPKPLTELSANGIYFFALSRDGKQLALSRGAITKDAVLITEER